MRLLIKGGHLINPATGTDELQDILIRDKVIDRVAPSITPQPEDTVIEAKGRIVTPGFIDMHTHLRQPGREDEETITTGSQAAVAGGFTTVVCMPNTSPPCDNQAVVNFILSQASKNSYCNVYPIGCITKGRKGQELAEIGELKQSGVVALSDDGDPVMNAEIMRRALEYASMFDLPIISHCEDLNLSGNGVMNEGVVATTLGLKGIPALSEEIMVARDIALAEMTGARLHIAHVSSIGSVALVKRARERGIRVTAEATPHHFTLTEEAVKGFDTNTKINPPLRRKEDVKAVIAGLRSGVIDVIVTDHAPHNLAEKELEYDNAPFGIVGLETALPLAITKLHFHESFSLPEIVAKLTINPARILGLDRGNLIPGAIADITIFEPGKTTVVDVTKFRSRSKNSPFHGWQLKGVVQLTIVAGRIVYP